MYLYFSPATLAIEFSASQLPNASHSIMRFSSVALLLFSAPVFGIRVTYDPVYDNRSGSLNTVACSNGENGLITRGFTTFGSLPSFPRIGGAFAVPGWNSPNCGSCWRLTYRGRSINVLAIDHASNSFNIAQRAMDILTLNQSTSLGVIDATFARVNPSNCGL